MGDNAFENGNGDIKNSIVELNNIRNRFIHFLPCFWGCSVSGLHHYLKDALKVMSFWVENCTEFRKYFDEKELFVIEHAINECMMELDAKSE